jgi:protein-tyrosine-phosphatase
LNGSETDAADRVNNADPTEVVEMRIGKLMRVAAAGLFLSAGSFCVQAESSDPYLQMLEDEAQTLELIRNAERQDEAAVGTATGSATQNAGRSNLAEGLSREQFEQALKARFIGTNTLYEKLSEAAKQDVYVSYQRDSRIMEIRRSVASHL